MGGSKIFAVLAFSLGIYQPLFVASAQHPPLSPEPKAATVAKQAALPLPDIRQTGFVYCVNGMIDSFNPQIASGGVLIDTLAAQLYDRLLDVDPYTYRLVSELAESWETLDNGATYRFKLKKGVDFQTTPWFTPSRQMTADDVLFSFGRILDDSEPYHQINGGSYPYFDSVQFKESVQSIRKINDYTVEIRLNQPDASFLWHLATHYAPILSAEYAQQLTKIQRQEQIDRLPVGTGPFILEEYRANQFVRLLRHPNYWRGLPRMQQIVIDLGAGGTGRLSKLLTGECDVLAYPAASQLSILRADPRLRLSLRTGMNLAYLAFNTARAPLNDYRVREAISLAINNERLMQSIYYGTAETATSILPRASWAYDDNIKVSDYDPERAKQLLKQAGITELYLHLWVPNSSQAFNPSPLKMAELIQADLAKVDIKLTIVPIEGRFQNSRLSNKKNELTLTGWSTDSNDPDSFLRPLLSCAAIQSQTNFTHWCNEQFDGLLQQGVSAQQLSQRVDIYEQAQQLVEQERPVLPLASSLRIQAYRYDIKGLVLSPFGNSSFAGVYRESDEGEAK